MRPAPSGAPAPARSRAGDPRTLWAATSAHFLNDFYVSFLAPLLPLVVVKFNLSLALAGFLATVLTTSAAMSQPLFGALADRMRRRLFVVVGPLLTIAAMGLIGLAPTYPILLGLLLLAGTGTASFHPQGASSAGQASGARLGRGLSLFVTGGELGYSIGPLLIAIVVHTYGLASTWWVAIPGLVACALLWRFIPPRSPLPAAAATGSLRADLRAAFAPLFVLWLIVVLRSVIISAYQTFLPLLLQQRGGSIIEGGWAVFLFGGIGALGGISGGTLSDRYGRRRMLALSLILGVPMLFAFVRTTGALAYVFLAAGGIAIYLSAAVTIVMAQELLPHRASVASSIVMGLAWGTAGLSLTAVGAIGDVIGLEGALTWTLTLAVVALAAVMRLPARHAPERAPVPTG